MKKILSLLLPLLALAGGVAGGAVLRPADSAKAATGPDKAAVLETASATDNHGGAGSHGSAQQPHAGAAGEGPEAWFTFPSQFFVPMVRNGDMGAIMILTLSLETAEERLEAMKREEHRLRDALLRQLMIHANTGGFDGNYTSEATMRKLREGLLNAARTATSLPVRQVLIEDIARQGG